MINNPQSPVVRKPVGGVAAVLLTSVDNILDAEFADNGRGEICLHLRFGSDSEVMECRLLEDRSSFVETMESSATTASVTHRLTLVADRNLAEGWLEPGFTAELLNRGAAAVITLADGRQLLAGVSRKFGCEQPLRLKKLNVDSARQPVDEPTVVLVLESVDTAFAAQLNT